MYVPGFTCELLCCLGLAKEPLKTVCIIFVVQAALSLRFSPTSVNRAVSRSERLNYCLSGQFLEVSYNVSLPGDVPLTGLHKSRPDKRSAIRRYYLGTALQQHRLNMADGARRVQPLRTYTDAVHDAMAAEYAESIT